MGLMGSIIAQEKKMANIGYSCAVCSLDESSGWTCRGRHWLCSKCSQIHVAIFYDNGSVGVAIVGGPADGTNIVVEGHIIDHGYRVDVPDLPLFSPPFMNRVGLEPTTSPKFHYVDYKFDWELQFFVLRK